MFDNLRDGPVPCVVRGRTTFRQTVPKKGRCEEAIASTSSPSGRSIFAHRPGEVQRNGPPHLRRLGGDGRITNEQQVDEIGGSRRPVALYSCPGSGRLCDAAR